MNAVDGLPPKSLAKIHAGFTLVELLVAAALTVLIAGVLSGLAASILTHWDRTAGALSADEQARDALNQLERDLNGAWHRDDGNTWLEATIQPAESASGVWVGDSKPVAGSLDVAAEDLREARFGRAGVWLRFFANAQIGNYGDTSAPVAVAYQIIRRAPTTSDSSAHYLLYRSEVTPAATLAVGYDLSAPPYTVAADDIGAPGSVVRPAHRQMLADNIVDFGVRLFAYVPDAAAGTTVLKQIFPAGAADLEYRATSPRTPTDTIHPFPSVVEVLVRVLTPEGARQILALESGRMVGDWWAIAAAHSKVFVRRISVKGRQP